VAWHCTIDTWVHYEDIKAVVSLHGHKDRAHAYASLVNFVISCIKLFRIYSDEVLN
jgi:hypothetical protein